MLEDKCHMIDIKIIGKLALNDETLDQEEYDKFITTEISIRNLEHAIADCEEKIILVHDAIATNLIRTPEENENEIYLIQGWKIY